MDFTFSFPFLAQASDAGDTPSEVVGRMARQLFSSPSEVSITAAIVGLVAGIVIQILAWWIAAKVVMGNENATFARAAYLWLLTLLVGIGMAVLLVVCLLLAATTQQPILMVLVGGGWLLLAFALALLLPAKVFDTDLLRALGIVVLSALLVLAGQTALDQARGQSTLARWRPLQRMILDSNQGRQRRIKQLIRGDPLAAIESDLDRLSSPAERKKSFSERQEGLRAVFAALEQRRKTIRTNDRETLTAYESMRQRYEELVIAMRADYSASQSPRPAATPR